MGFAEAMVGKVVGQMFKIGQIGLLLQQCFSAVEIDTVVLRAVPSRQTK